MIYVLARPMAVDEVCRDHYGDESGYLEAVLVANPGLASSPVIKPAGTRIVLPEIEAAEPDIPVVALWS